MAKYNEHKSKVSLLIRMVIVVATAYVVYRIGDYIM